MMLYMDIPLSKISRIKFYILSPEDIRTMSSVEVKNSVLFQNDKPYPGGIYDAHMGTTDNSWQCETCQNNKQLCPGHYGYLKLKTHILSPLFIPFIYSILKKICYTCGKFIEKTNCVCGAKQPVYSKSRSDQLLFYIEHEKSKRKQRLHPFQIYEIFSRIPKEEVKKMKFPGKFHPTHLVPNIICVCPNSVRPDARFVVSNKSNSNDLTVLLQNVLKVDSCLSIIRSDNITEDDEKLIYDLCHAVYEYIRGPYPSTDKNVKIYIGALMNKIPKKEGILRKHVLGKRTWSMARTIITCDTDLPIDTVGVPLAIAKELQKRIVVRDYNFEECLIYYQNGSKAYPGAKTTRLLNTNYQTSVDIINRTRELKIGDVLHRNLIDGDVINLNRQPTLEQCSTTSVTVKTVDEDTLKLNVNICECFNADFDGDNMNAQNGASEHTSNEISLLSNIKEVLISAKNSQIKVSEVLDGLMGLYNLTKSSTNFTRYHMLNILNALRNPLRQIDIARQFYTGRDIITFYFLHQKLFVNFKKNTTLNGSIYQNFFTFPDNDKVVEFRYGRMVSGVLDKVSVGSGVMHNLFHSIFNVYGGDAVLKTSYDLQQMALYHDIRYNGFSITYRDFYINKACKREINEVLVGIVNNAQLITQNYWDGFIVPPFGQDVESYYETLLMNALETNDLVIGILLKYLTKDNNLLTSIIVGAKGAAFNLKNILAYVGLITLNGKMIQPNFSYGRTLCYSRRFDSDPMSRGFILRSYSELLRVVEFILHSHDGRFSIVQKAMSTSVAGTSTRKGMKCCDSLIVNNLFQVESTTQIVQFIYGEDGFSQKYHEQDIIHLIDPKLTTADFKAKYRVINKNAELQKLLDEEYEKLLKIREKNLLKYKYTIYCPLNIDLMIKNFNIQQHKPSPLNIKDALVAISKFCNNLVYIYSNDIQEKLQNRLPKYFYVAIKKITIYLYGYLNIATLIENNIDNNLLNILFQKIRFRLAQSLIKYGTPIGSIATMSITEPLTQKILNSHHYSGAGGTKRNFMESINAIFSCKDTSLSQNASMNIYFNNHLQYDLYAIRSTAFNMKMIKLHNILSGYQIINEGHESCLIPEENKDIEDFKKFTNMKPPSNLIDICFKLIINKFKMAIYNVTSEQLYLILHNILPNHYIMYNSKLSDVFYFKIYLSGDDNHTMESLKTLIENITQHVIKGIPNITAATVKEENIQIKKSDGSIELKKIYYIQTSGTNLQEIFSYHEVDTSKTTSDSIIEINRLMGVISARNTILQELIHNLEGVDIKHYMLYADLMCLPGKPTNIDRFGSKERNESILCQISDSSPIGLLINAALNEKSDYINKISNSIVVGQTPKIGDNFNDFELDISQFSATDILEDI